MIPRSRLERFVINHPVIFALTVVAVMALLEGLINGKQ